MKTFSLLTLSLLLAAPLLAEKVALQKEEGRKAALLVNGQPFEIHGVGGGGSLEKLKSSGGNAIRTWAIDENTGALLDEAQAKGIKVALGFWLGHERHGFSYTDWDSNITQAENLFAAVRKHKDHPAVLLWALGNEMEGFKETSNPAIYTQIEYLARKVKEIDPDHPIMSITAEIGKKQIEGLNRFCPSVDIHGINSYGGGPSIPERYKAGGGVKPYVITEFGPAGTWERPDNKWGMPNEGTSTEKAADYRKSYEAFAADPLCLGSFAFMWGTKQEASATWFGMLLSTGEKVAAVDELTQLWTGKTAENLCPVIESLELGVPNEELDPSATITVNLKVSDPEDDPLEVQWILTEDWKEVAEGGDFRASPPQYPEAILPDSTNEQAKIKLPSGGGTYRIYAFIRDGKGSAATGNISIKIKGERKPIPAEELATPVEITGAAVNGPWAPSGWMGNTEKLKMDEAWTENPKVGKECTKVSFQSDSGWAGVVWQHPSGDWGDAPGGFDLTGATKLSFWARGNAGGEKVTIGIGNIGNDKVYHDTFADKKELTLGTEWQEFEIDLTGKNLTRIKSALYFTTSSTGQPQTFFLDGVTIQ
ncbi:hypothetical protein N9F48_01575 [Akkermansiaceae bacterium]|nr:hypothetical protein [Akkermansiaceae bacterium]MDB4429473.1 hypothetical protein [Akkermansiaceae bacterium]MDB4504510.1 hypothetical protein [Akkermansiaceae bacterium]MDB4547051.1 hypothetical protein [Akkermansiaceae bacterium]